MYAPPAFTFPQSLHPQIPTDFLFTANCNKRVITPRKNNDSKTSHKSKMTKVFNKRQNFYYLSTKFTEILAVLTHFHFLDLLSQTSTISGAYKPRPRNKKKYTLATPPSKTRTWKYKEKQICYKAIIVSNEAQEQLPKAH